MRTKLHSVRAIVQLATLAILIVATTTAFLLWNSRSIELERAREERDAIADLFVKQAGHDLINISLVLKVVQERMQSPYGVNLNLDSPEVFLLLGARVAAAEPTSSMFIANAEGTIVNTSLGYPPNRLHIADRDYFKAYANNSTNEFFISRPVRNRIDNKWTIYFSRPLRWADGRLRGVLVAAVPPSRFEDLFATLRLGAKREMSLHMTDGTLLASQPHSEENIGIIVPQQATNKSKLRLTDPVAVREIKDFPMYVKVATDGESALTLWRETAIPIAFASLMVCLSIVGITILLRRELIREESLQQALSAADERHRHTVTSVMDAIIAIDDQQHIILFNPAAERMFGLPAADAIGHPLTVLIPENLRELHQQHVLSFMGSTRTSEMMAPKLDIFGLRSNGESFPIEATISRMEHKGQIQMTAVLRDISERRLAEENLRKANLQLRTLSTALQNVREEERTHISRELHDELGQQLTGLKLDLTWFGSRIREGRPALPERVDEMRQHLDRIIASVRRISSDLRPPVLDDLGFCEAVRWLKQETEKRSDLVIDAELPAGPLITDKNLATALFRIVQEALTNILRHADATRVAITLIVQNGKLVLTIQDNGKGADLEAPEGGIGLISMRERITALGGEFSFANGTPGHGVTLKALIPFSSLGTGKNKP
jgi:PAS domain S-box-containing protein